MRVLEIPFQLLVRPEFWNTVTFRRSNVTGEVRELDILYFFNLISLLKAKENFEIHIRQLSFS
jgi:hypothetical protein